MKELEKELVEEKKMNEEFEEKVRILRKAHNKARLKTEKETQPKKKDENGRFQLYFHQRNLGTSA